MKEVKIAQLLIDAIEEIRDYLDEPQTNREWHFRYIILVVLLECQRLIKGGMDMIASNWLEMEVIILTFFIAIFMDKFARLLRESAAFTAFVTVGYFVLITEFYGDNICRLLLAAFCQ